MGKRYTNWDAVALGTAPDHVFAAEYSVSVSAVYAARKVRGIPAHNVHPRMGNTGSTCTSCGAARTLSDVRCEGMCYACWELDTIGMNDPL